MTGIQQATFTAGYSSFTPITATGGTVTTTTIAGVPYKVHTFTAGGTFAVSSIGTTSGKVKACVVAGGGAGGWGYSNPGNTLYVGGGGGAGGLLWYSGTALYSGGPNNPLLTVSATSYAVTVGPGGTVTSTPAPTNGGNSSIGALATATGGGRGGTAPNTYFNYNGTGGSGTAYPASAGGSGGGGGSPDNGGLTTYPGGAASPSGQGFAGGYGTETGISAGSGGGATSAGQNYPAGGNNGGNSWTNPDLGGTYSHGGATNTNTTTYISAVLPAANSGNGGLGPVNDGTGGWRDVTPYTNYMQGSSGIVIIYYPTDRSL
jgi:hypothetical protein